MPIPSRVGQTLPKGSKLEKLNACMEADSGILRVGRCLLGSALPLDHRHPPILPHDTSYSRLIVHSMHLVSLHGRPLLTASFVNQHTWILGSRLLVQLVVKYCKPLLSHKLIANLSASCVTASRPFITSGLDYAGPFQVRSNKGRGYRSFKAYVVLFVCFITRALHFELVSDLTSNEFIAGFRRFTSRRGLCRRQEGDSELRGMFKVNVL
jgi:hypothetical protein